jgi:hypothetical protein
VTALAVNQSPALQLSQPADYRSAGHPHIGSDFGDGKWLAFKITNRYAQADEERLQADAEGFARWSVGAVNGPHDVDHQAAEHQSLPGFLYFAGMILG